MARHPSVTVMFSIRQAPGQRRPDEGVPAQMDCKKIDQRDADNKGGQRNPIKPTAMTERLIQEWRRIPIYQGRCLRSAQ